MATALSSCDGWIDNAKTPNNMLTTEQITTPSMLATIRTENIKDGAMIANVKTLAGVAASAAFLTSGAMTDEVEPTAKPNFLIYKQLKSDDVKPNSDVADTWNKLQNFRARAEEVLQVERKTLMPYAHTPATLGTCTLVWPISCLERCSRKAQRVPRACA